MKQKKSLSKLVLKIIKKSTSPKNTSQYIINQHNLKRKKEQVKIKKLASLVSFSSISTNESDYTNNIENEVNYLGGSMIGILGNEKLHEEFYASLSTESRLNSSGNDLNRSLEDKSINFQ